MNPWRELETSKRKRLVSKGVLPTTLTGIFFVYDRKTKQAIPTFPHLLTPFNQPFRKYQGLFGSYKSSANGAPWGAYEHWDAADLTFHFIDFFSLDPIRNPTFESSAFYKQIINQFPPAKTIDGYCFFRSNGCIYYLQRKKETISLRKLKDSLYKSPHDEFYQLVLSALSLDTNEISKFYTDDDLMQNGGIFTNLFNNTLIFATYSEAFKSFINKMKDNFYQLGKVHPYYMIDSLIHLEPSRFFYHVLGMFHALISIALDTLVELTALVTRSLFARGAKEPSELFPEAEPLLTSEKEGPIEHVLSF